MASLADTYLDTAAASEEDRLWGETVTLKRSTLTTANVIAQTFSGERKVTLESGSYIQFFLCEWIITKARYVVAGEVARPRKGDRIVESDGTEWELLPIEDLSEVVEQAGGLEWLLRTKRVVF